MDVEAIVRHYADVEVDALPTGAEALLLYPSANRSRPLLVISSSSPHLRRRFTLAHELGHIIIPWHLGELAYRPEQNPQLRSAAYQTAEAEANRFASELLAPSVWVRSLFVNEATPKFVASKVAAQADISTHAASIAAILQAPPGVMLIVSNRSTGHVVSANKSEGTAVKLPDVGDGFDPSRYGEFLTGSEVDHSIDVDFNWMQFPTSVAVERSPHGDARSLLKRVLDETRVFDSAKLGQRISAITAAVNGSERSLNRAELFAKLQQRFAGETTLGPCVNHPLFVEYLKSRASELRP